MHQYPTFTPISNLSRNDVFGNHHLHGLLQSSNQKRYICDIVNTSKMHQYPPFTSISYRRANHCFQNVPRCHCSRLFEFIPNWQFFECVWLSHAVPRWQRSATALHSFRSAGSRMYQPGFCKPNTKFAAPAPPRLTYFKYTYILPLPGFSTSLKNKFASIGTKSPPGRFVFQQAISSFFFPFFLFFSFRISFYLEYSCDTIFIIFLFGVFLARNQEF